MKEKDKAGITWNEQSLRWLLAAGEYTDYNQRMAEILLSYMPERGTVCDIGCGAGLVDLELAKAAGQMTCVDISPVAVEFVKTEAKQRGISNLTAICMDGRALDGSWDTVVTLFHGGGKAYLDYQKFARHTLLMVTHGMLSERFGPENRRPKRCHGTELTKQELDVLGVDYELVELELEHGQPFVDRMDAKQFVQTYSMSMEDDELMSYLEEQLVATGSEEYPYYLPKKKKIGLFIIRKDGVT